jgi:phosphotransferase family enzyme
MKPLTILTTLTGAAFLIRSRAGGNAEAREEKGAKLWARHRRSFVLPEDAALPGLTAIRARGVAEVMPMLGLDGNPVELVVCRYATGRRIALEVRSGDRHFALKAYAEPPEEEVELYQALAGGSHGVRVPPLLGWNRELGVMAIGWVEGPDVTALIERGEGWRAGELAALWVESAPALPVRFGRAVETGRLLAKAWKWAAVLEAADRGLGTAASAVVKRLSAVPPPDCAPRLVHGSFYDRHVIDVGDGVGLVDWESFGQGPAELDAGVFLSMVWRIGLRDESQRAESARATAAFLDATSGLLDERALAWHRARTLLDFAHKKTRRSAADRLVEAGQFLVEATRLAADT